MAGRPPLNLDRKLITRLARIHCTHEEIASVVGCSVDTIKRNFADCIEKGREEGKASLRRKQFSVAMKGNVGMLIWLGKQHLAQTDQQTIRVGDMEQLSDNQLEELAKGKLPPVRLAS